MINITKLNCGIRLITEKMPHVQSVCTGVWVHAGAAFEPAHNAGISHFIEHMLFKGTENRTAKQIAHDIDRIGGQTNAFTSKETTCYYIKTLSTNFVKAAEILSDMFLNSLFDKDEMDRERNVIFEEIKMIEDSPDDDIHDIVCEQVFHGSSMAKSILGTPTSLQKVKTATVKAYMNSFYTRENTVIAIAGNFDETEVKETLERLFSPLPSGVPDLSMEYADYVPRFRSKVKDIEQCHISLGTKTIKMDDDRYYALTVLNNILGGSMSSRLFQGIREQKGLAYSVYSSNNSYAADGYFSIYAGVSQDNVKKAVAAVMEELALLGKDGITEEELAIAKEQMKSQYIFSQENVNSRMFSIGRHYILLEKVYTPTEVLGKIDQLSLEDMREVAKLITDPGAYSGAVLGRAKYDVRKLIQG